MKTTTVGAWLGFAMCLFSGCGDADSSDPGLCDKQKCSDIASQIKAEDAAHPEFNPDHRTDVCGDLDTGAGAIEHYVQACKALRDCIALCP